MIDFGIGAAVGAIGNLISGKMNADYQERMMREQMDWQEKMNAQQQEWQEGMWNRTNEYNTPSAQLDRMVAAGINPNNAAMQVAGGSNNAQMAQQPQTPTAPNGFSPGIDIMRGINDIELMKSQKENIDSQTAKNEAEAEKIKSDKSINVEQLELNKKQFDAYKSNIDKVNAQIEQSIELNKSEKEYKDELVAYQHWYNNTFVPIIEKQEWQKLDNMRAEYDKAKAEIHVLGKQADALEQQVKESKARVAMIQSETDKNAAQEELMKQEAQLKQIQRQMDNIRLEYNKKFGFDPRDTGIANQFIISGARLFNNVGRMLDYSNKQLNDLIIRNTHRISDPISKGMAPNLFGHDSFANPMYY